METTDSGERSREEAMARAVFQAAIKEGRCADLWDCLTEGGTATVDAITRKLVIRQL